MHGSPNALESFARGTRLATPFGESPVERLAQGDMVLTRTGPAAIRWTATRTACDPPGQIRIAAHAIDGKLPRRDLVLCADLAVVIDGLTLPITGLVNGATIVHDPVPHEQIQLALNHAPGIVAEGLTIARAPETSAPHGPAVIGMHARLLEQAQRLGWSLTDAPALHLVVDDERITPARMDRGWYAFPIPGGVRDMRIVSRAASPADLDPQTPDTRRLGVMIDRLVLRCRQREREFALRDRALAEGFHPPESDGLAAARWTDGNARLRLTRAARTRAELLVHVERGQVYWVGPSASQ
jgi:hypothetical protein